MCVLVSITMLLYVYNNTYLFPIVYFQIQPFPRRRQTLYPRKIRAWHFTLGVTLEYGFRVRHNRGNIKYLREGTHHPGVSLECPAPACIYACLVTGTMSRRLSTMGFADVTTLAANPLHSSSVSLRRVEKERKCRPRSSFLSGFRGESPRTRGGKIHDLWRQRYCSPKCEKVSGGGGAFEFSTPLTRTSCA